LGLFIGLAFLRRVRGALGEVGYVASIVVLLAQLPPVVREILEGVFADQADIRVVGAVNGPVELLVAAGQTEADVVILEMDDTELPGVASHLLDQYPRLKILTVTADGRRMFLYQLRPQLVSLGEMEPHRLLQTIRTIVGSEES
jgi:DNA-binding NarL/FixJ family response regulator